MLFGTKVGRRFYGPPGMRVWKSSLASGDCSSGPRVLAECCRVQDVWRGVSSLWWLCVCVVLQVMAMMSRCLRWTFSSRRCPRPPCCDVTCHVALRALSSCPPPRRGVAVNMRGASCLSSLCWFIQPCYTAVYSSLIVLARLHSVKYLNDSSS